MARKNTLNYRVAVAQSLSSAFTSSPTLIRYLDNISYQINITTTNSVGTFKVQGSVDYAVNEGNDSVVTNSGNWVDLILGGGTPFANAANDNILISMNQVPFNALRIVYTSSVAGTGTCDIYIMAKMVGG